MDADKPSLLFQTHDAIDLALRDHMPDFVIAKAALWALEPDVCHPNCPLQVPVALSDRVGEVPESASRLDCLQNNDFSERGLDNRQ